MNTPPTKDDFARLLSDRIRQAGEKCDIIYEVDEFRLRGQGERACILHLHNAHREYCAVDVDSREQVIRDDGPGFDVAHLPDVTADPAYLISEGGRGLVLIDMFMDEVRFNATGNEIALVKRALGLGTTTNG